MTTIDNKTILNHLEWRYATKSFDPSLKISNSDWEMLSEVIRLTPSSYGLQPWKVHVVQNPALRQRLRKASWDQSQIENCSHLVVFSALKKVDEAYIQKYISRISNVRGVPEEQLKEYQGMMVDDVVKGPRSKIIQFWAQRQAYIAIGFLLQAAALKQIDACPMEGLQPEEYDKILELNQSDYATVAVVALGYRAKDDRFQSLKKVRFDTKEIITVVN